MKNNKRIVTRLLVVLLLAGLLAGCTQTPKRPEMPLIWKVTDGTTDLYLFGSIHAAESTMYPFDPVIEEAYEASDYLAVEVDVSDLEQKMQDPAVLMELAPYMYYMDGGNIIDVIGQELFDKAKVILQAAQPELTDEALAALKPYTWISTFTGLTVADSGLDPTLGVDMYFLKRAHESGKPILEVESLQSQLEMFDNFSPLNVQYQIESVLDTAAATEELKKLYENYRTGNLEALASSAETEEEVDPKYAPAVEEYTEALITNRNILMADAAEQYLKEGKSVFYVVGALHMVGDGGLADLLAERGYTVELLP